MRGMNWPAECDACASTWFVFDPEWAAVNDFNPVWIWISLGATPMGTQNLTTGSYDVTIIQPTCAVVINAFVNKFNCSKLVTMDSRSLATGHMSDDYSSSNERSFCSRCGWHDTLLLLTVLMKVLVECIIETALSYVSVRFEWNNKKKLQKLAALFFCTGNIYL